MKRFFLDTTALGGDRADDGLVWPIHLREYERNRTLLQTGMAGVLRRAARSGVAEVNTYRIIATYLHHISASLLQAALLAERLGEGHLAAAPPETFPLWHGYRTAEFPSQNALYQSLMTAYSRKRLRERVRRKFTKRASPKPANRESPPASMILPCPRLHSASLLDVWNRNVVLSTKRDRLISFHAQAGSQKVAYVPHKKWFQGLDVAHAVGGMRQSVNAVLEEELLHELSAVHEMVVGRAMRQDAALFFGGHMARMAKIANAYLNGIRRRRLPRELWTGTASFYDRILRAAVQERGGRSVGHDHAWGMRYLLNDSFSFNELIAIDSFIAQNDNQARNMKARLDPLKLQYDEPPDIRSIPKLEIKDSGAHRISPAKARSVMYIVPQLNGEFIRQPMGMPDRTLLEWMLRLVPFLAGTFDKVILKIHPENPVDYPDMFKEFGNVDICDRNFEAVFDACDVVLFDNPSTTTFNYSLLNGIKMTLIDFGFVTFEKKANESLAKRIAIVPGTLAQGMMAQVDMELLSSALHRSVELDCNDFIQEWIL